MEPETISRSGLSSHATEESGEAIVPVRILPFARRPTVPPSTTPTAATPQIVDPEDPVSLLVSHLGTLRRLVEYATLQHAQATRLLEALASGANVDFGSVAELQEIATVAERDIVTTARYLESLEPWLDYLRGHGGA